MKKAKKKPRSNGTHLSLDDRVTIQSMLNERKTIRAIAVTLNRSPSTIMREIRNNATHKSAQKNDCALRNTCERRNMCGNTSCHRKCSKCTICKKSCSYYTKVFCDNLQVSPYVCNGCRNMNFCSYDKVIYSARKANDKYRSTLTNSRNGFDLTLADIIAIDEMVTPLIKQGQSLYHIVQALREKLPISESTLRRMIQSNELTARNVDLINTVQRRPRQSTTQKMHNEVLMRAKVGHLYKDYLEYKAENGDCAVQMDCVEGKKDENATLLTLHFPMFHMQLAIIMDYHNAHCVVEALDKIEYALGKELFTQVFPAILTDNGSEFTKIADMERSIYGGQRTKIFFCEPNRSDEKGSCENNHKYIRYVIPKGSSLESFTQSDISKMMNHINSYCRKSLYGKSPYEVAMAVLPQDFFYLLGLEKIPAEEVILKERLLKNTSTSM